MRHWVFVIFTSALTGVGLASAGLGISDIGFWCGLLIVGAFNGAIGALRK